MTIASAATPRTDATVDMLLPQLRAASLRLLTAVLRLGDAELVVPARSGLGTRRHVIARMTRHADRTARAIEGDASGVEPADRLHDLSPADLLAALTAALGSVLGALQEHTGATVVADPTAAEAATHAREQLAWLELSHVDLDAGYAMHDVPDASLDAVAAHFRDARAASASDDLLAASPFAPLMAG
ncbi:DinB family protein [Agrococcus jejuensis]|uniref:Mycothiol maleylpyruvate isomerase N-terminal domain-containing protein n=1 Tax=Agrococcus jejuensis TaxID=399736 RepID=A0A1G8ERG1_9MICO|nr:hypothetical protein [Agrococcus jejuensis]SDH72407.1 hypothetical protein SAMN04489720_2159 [Agrococcus jejuensis]